MRSIDFIQSLNSAAFVVHTSISIFRCTLGYLFNNEIVTEPFITYMTRDGIPSALTIHKMQSTEISTR